MSCGQYELDGEDRIRSVNEPWCAFARANEAEHLIDAVVGTSIWDWIEGMEVRHLYQLLFSRVRRHRPIPRLPFRCDSPGVRRFMELDLSVLPDDGLLCKAQLKRTERRPPVSLLDSSTGRSQALVIVCSWCKRVRVNRGLWLEVEQAVSALGLLESEPPGITHTICTDCESQFDEAG
jgi:hypothetical protein